MIIINISTNAVFTSPEKNLNKFLEGVGRPGGSTSLTNKAPTI